MFSRLALFLFIIFPFSLLLAVPYEDVRHELHFDYPQDWLISTSNSGRSIDLVHPESIATMSVTVLYFETPVTANGLQLMRMASRYDGWINKFQRFGKPEELQQSGANELFLAVYTKRELADDLSTIDRVVSEYYYVNQKRAYVITTQTQKRDWAKVQPALKQLVDHFWVGLVKPEVVPVASHSFKQTIEGWVTVGRNSANQFSVPSKPIVSTSLKKKWTRSFPIDPALSDAKGPLLTPTTLYTVIDRRVYALDVETGVTRWAYDLKAQLVHGIVYADDILYVCVEQKGDLFLMGLYAVNGSILFKRSLPKGAGQPIFYAEKIFVPESSRVSVYAADTGERLSEVDVTLRQGTFPAFLNDVMVGYTEDDTVMAWRVSTQEVLWTFPLSGYTPLFSPTLVDQKVIVSTAEEGDQRSKLVAISLETGEGIWEFKHKSIAFYPLTAPTVLAQTLAIPMHIQAQDAVGNIVYKQLLVGFDLVSGTITWQQPFETVVSDIHRPVLTDGVVLMVNDTAAPVMTYDQFTGEKVAIRWPKETTRPVSIVALRAMDGVLVVMEKYGDFVQLRALN